MDEFFQRMLSWLDFDEVGGRMWNGPSNLDPEEFTSDILDTARDYSRWLYGSNGFAICAIENRRNYVINQGLSYEVVDADENKPADPVVLEAVKSWIRKFSEINDLASLEYESMMRYDRDGEAILRLFDSWAGVEVRFVEPDWLNDSRKTGNNQSMGVICAAPDWTQPMGYQIGDEIVPESEIVHIPRVLSSRMQRGLPSLFAAFTSLSEAADLLRGMTKAAKARAKIALLIKVAGLNAATAPDLMARLNAQAQVSDPENNRRSDVPTEKMEYGSAVRIGSQDEWTFPSAQLGAGEYVEVLQARLRFAAACVQMPEWMFTAYTQDKYANAFAAESPARRAFNALQGKFCRCFGSARYGPKRSLLWKSIERAVRLGRLPQQALSQIAIKAVASSLEVRDAGADANVNLSYLREKVWSLQTVRQKSGVDDQEEAARIQKEAEEAQKQQQAQQQQAQQQPQQSPEPDLPLPGMDGLGVFGESETLLEIAEAAESDWEWVSENWQAYTITRGPRKGQQVFRHSITKKLRDTLPKAKPEPNPNQPKPQELVAKVQGLDGKEVTPENETEVLENLAGMTVKDLTEVKSKLGLKLSGKNKAEFLKKLQDKTLELIRAKAKQMTPEERQKALEELAPTPEETAAAERMDEITRNLSPENQTPVTMQSRIEDNARANGETLAKKGAAVAAKGQKPNPALSDETRPQLTPEESGALNHLTENLDTINAPLWKNEAVLDIDGAAAKRVQDAFAKTKELVQPVTTFLPEELSTEAIERLKRMMESGEPLIMSGFQKTSTDPRMKTKAGTPGNITFQITARSGIDLAPHSAKPGESDFLINHNSIYRVKKIGPVPLGDPKKTLIEIEQISDDGRLLSNAGPIAGAMKYPTGVDPTTGIEKKATTDPLRIGEPKKKKGGFWSELWTELTRDFSLLPKWGESELLEIIESDDSEWVAEAVENWKSYTITRGPRKGQQVFRHSVTRKLRDKLPQARVRRSAGDTEPKTARNITRKKPIKPAIDPTAPVQGGTFGKVSIKGDTADQEQEVQQRLKNTIGDRKLTDPVVYGIANSTPGTQLILSTSVRGDGQGIRLRTVSADSKVEAIRELYRDKRGLVLKNGYFRIDAGSEHESKGLEFFVNQIRAARDIGVDVIETFAAGDAKNKTYNGYYTWPRFGYDGNINKGTLGYLPENLKKQMGDRVNIQALFETEEGRDWWKKNGEPINLTFDPTPGSPNMKVLEAYTRERSTRKKPEKVAETPTRWQRLKNSLRSMFGIESEQLIPDEGMGDEIPFDIDDDLNYTREQIAEATEYLNEVIRREETAGRGESQWAQDCRIILANPAKLLAYAMDPPEEEEGQSV